MQAISNNLGLFVDRKGEQYPFLKVEESVTLTPQNHIVRVADESGAVTVTLPPVADCAGCIFAITAETGDTNTTTVTDQDDSLGWVDAVLEGDEASVFIFCDGQKFWVLASQAGETT